MFQLRLFVHQRMCAAAEDILGQVEKAIMLALSEAEDARSKDVAEDGLRHQLSPPAKETGFSLTTSTTEHGDEGNASVLQENQDSTEMSNLCQDPEVPRPSEPPADDRSFAATNFKMVEIKVEEAGENQTPEPVTAFPSPGFIKSEQDQPRPLKIEPFSFNSAASLGESDDDELMNSTVGNENENDEAGSHPTKEEKEHCFCRLCGKSFVDSTSLRNHMKTHDGIRNCGFCGLKHQTADKLITHLKRFHKKSHFCDVCGRTFAAKNRLTRHKKIHTGNKDFVCQECGKAFYRKEHLVGHVRTHSGEKPFQCEICGKAFTHSQNVMVHKRIHTGEKPYHCHLCGRPCVTRNNLNQHLVSFHTS